jgi:hypothetical protein
MLSRLKARGPSRSAQDLLPAFIIREAGDRCTVGSLRNDGYRDTGPPSSDFASEVADAETQAHRNLSGRARVVVHQELHRRPVWCAVHEGDEEAPRAQCSCGSLPQLSLLFTH